jgi:glutamate synthase domain-containing protein 1
MIGTAAQSPYPGLYDPTYEQDACGVAFVARLNAPPSADVVENALVALEHLEHRGGQGADPGTGDGAGILLQLPHAFLSDVVDFDLPEPGRYGVGVCFLPQADGLRTEAIALIERTIEAEGQTVLGWREVPVDQTCCGEAALRTAPYIAQVFVGAGEAIEDWDALERALYVTRRVIEREHLEDLAIATMSSRTLVY